MYYYFHRITKLLVYKYLSSWPHIPNCLGLVGGLLRATEHRNIYPWRHHQSPSWSPFEHPDFSFYIAFIFFSPFRQQWLEVWELSFLLAPLFPPLFLNQGPVKMFPGPFSATPAPTVKPSALGAGPRISKAGFSQQHGLKTQMPAKSLSDIQQSLSDLPQPCIPQSDTDELGCSWDPIPKVQPVSSSLLQ